MFTKEEMIAAIKSCTEKLGRVPTVRELQEMSGGEVTKARVEQKFGTYTRALAACGLERQDQGRPYTMMQLFKSWGKVAREQKRVPTISDFHVGSGHGVHCMLRRFRRWNLVAGEMLKFMREQNLVDEWKDVAEIIRTSKPRRNGLQSSTVPEAVPYLELKTAEESAAMMPESAPAIPVEMLEAWPPTGSHAALLTTCFADEFVEEKSRKPQYGTRIWHPAMSHAPTNEDGVLVLLGAMAQQIGLSIMRIQKAFPDGEGMRLLPNGRWEHVLFEVEFESRNFRVHMHDLNGCDFIVCWEHNWKECPLPVVELKKLVATRK